MSITKNAPREGAEEVAATALGVAAARAAETRRQRPLIVDPFAQLFVDAAGQDLWSMVASGAAHDELASADPALAAVVQTSLGHIASRTKFFDEFVLAAADAGIRQVVSLGAGLDTRAWRLSWPDAVTVYELEQPNVLEFKLSTLRDNGATPAANYVDVPVATSMLAAIAVSGRIRPCRTDRLAGRRSPAVPFCRGPGSAFWGRPQAQRAWKLACR